MTNVGKELDALAKMTRDELQERWRRIYRSDPPPRISKDLMVRIIAHRIQEDEYGGLDIKTKRRLRSFARSLESEGELPLPSGPSLKPGAKLIREWHGRTYNVIALEKGFKFDGRRYRSLSQIAREITGARWSGRRFFGLPQIERSPSHGEKA